MGLHGRMGTEREVDTGTGVEKEARRKPDSEVRPRWLRNQTRGHARLTVPDFLSSPSHL